MATNVVNLATGAELTYVSLHPIEAVLCAFLQDIGDYNTWSYADAMARMFDCLVFGRHTVCYGDWCAKLT